MRQLIARLLENMKLLDRQVKEFEAQIKAWHRCQELQERSSGGGVAGPGAQAGLGRGLISKDRTFNAALDPIGKRSPTTLDWAHVGGVL